MNRESVAIEIKDLHKTYRGAKVETLHGINLTVKAGEFLGILGPNGVGKTTMINCVTGVSEPTSGIIKVFGHDVVKEYRQARSFVGVSPQEFNVDIFDTVDNILDFAAGFFGIVGERMRARREELIKQFELEAHRGKKFQQLSGGLKRRAVLAKAMMHDPQVLILDEPTAGVDVETRHTLWKYLAMLHSQGKTIVLTSHYLEEVQSLCKRVAIIRDGLVVVDSDMESLTKDKTLESVYLDITSRNKGAL